MSHSGSVRGSLDRALQFLDSHYGKYESWCDFSTPKFGSSTVWVTAYVACCVSEAALEPPALNKALQFLLRSQLGAGGWGWGPPAPADCDTTSMCALLFSGRQALSAEQAQRVRSFIEVHQRESGGFATFHDYKELKAIPVYHNVDSQFRGWCAVHNSVSAAALQAMMALGAAPDSDPVRRGVQFLADTQGADGLWSCYWWTSPYYPTLQAVRAASATQGELGCSSDIDVSRALQTLLKIQREDGSWAGMDRSTSCPFSTALALQTLLTTSAVRSGELAEPIARSRRFLLETQTDAGCWVSPLPIMRVPHRDELDPERNSALKPDQEKLKTDIFHVFTTANVCMALQASQAVQS